MNSHNTIHFVSLGPGGADHVTLGNARQIEAADKVYCFGSGGKSHCADTLMILGHESKTEVIDIPMASDRTDAMTAYEALARKIAIDYHDGKRIAVATEGDTGLFATTHYVMDILTDHGISCRQHAGVPAFIAAGAMARLHLAKLDERLLIVPGTITADELGTLVENGTNVVIMKPSKATEEIHKCIRSHPEFQYHYFRNVGMADEKYIYDKVELAEMHYPYFSIMIIMKQKEQ
jgi:precorrin-2/cobalt-factor-2 C20-methyltransferase